MKNITLKWNSKTKKTLSILPSKIVEDIALETLNRASPTIPMSSALARNSTRGRLRRETVAMGVQNNGNIYFLESPTYYSKYVYNMNNATTNWSTPGTQSKWFDMTWTKDGKSITNNAVERNRL